MNLNDWMNGPPTWKNKDLAKEIGMDQSYLSEIRNGRVPSIELAKKIAEFTNHQVTVNELLKLDSPQNVTETKG